MCASFNSFSSAGDTEEPECGPGEEDEYRGLYAGETFFPGEPVSGLYGERAGETDALRMAIFVKQGIKKSGSLLQDDQIPATGHSV